MTYQYNCWFILAYHLVMIIVLGYIFVWAIFYSAEIPCDGHVFNTAFLFDRHNFFGLFPSSKLHVREVQKEALSGRHENIPYLWVKGDTFVWTYICAFWGSKLCLLPIYFAFVVRCWSQFELIPLICYPSPGILFFL